MNSLFAKRRLGRRRAVFAVGALLIIVGAGYGSFSLLQYTEAPSAQNAGAVYGTKLPQEQANEGKETMPLPRNALDSYTVAADLPRAIYITKIGVAARLLPMGVNSDNSMQAPINTNDAGWYTGSSKPGQGGAMVIDGHASQTGTHYGLFGNLEKLVNGDKITVEQGDGTRFTYRVVHTEDVPESQVDMSKVMQPYGTATQGLNLITCAGEWVKGGSTLDHRILVFATPVS